MRVLKLELMSMVSMAMHFKLEVFKFGQKLANVLRFVSFHTTASLYMIHSLLEIQGIRNIKASAG